MKKIHVDTTPIHRSNWAPETVSISYLFNAETTFCEVDKLEQIGHINNIPTMQFFHSPEIASQNHICYH